MDIPLDNIVSSSELQKNYKKVFNKAKRTKRPVIVMRGDDPEVAVIDIKTLEGMEKRLEEMEINEALEAIAVADKEFREGKIKVLKSGGLAKLAGLKR